MDNLPKRGEIVISLFGINYGNNKICKQLGLTGGCTGLLIGYRTPLYGTFLFFSYGTGNNIMKCDFNNAVYSDWYPAAKYA